MFDIKDIHYYSVLLPLEDEVKDLFESSEILLPARLVEASEKRKNEYLTGRFCAQIALEKAGGEKGENISSLDDGAPSWPDGFVGSITHYSSFIAAACSNKSFYSSIGIDSQQVMSSKTLKNIQIRILTRKEFFLKIPGWSEEEIATLIFSFKESIYKCFKPLSGQFFGFQEAQILEIDLENNKITFEFLSDIGKEFLIGFKGIGYFKYVDNIIHTICIHR